MGAVTVQPVQNLGAIHLAFQLKQNDQSCISLPVAALPAALLCWQKFSVGWNL